MKKIISYILLLAACAGISDALYAYTGDAVSSKQRYNAMVMERIAANFADAVAYNKTHHNKRYYIKDYDVNRFFYAYFSSEKASKLITDKYEVLREAYDKNINDYIADLRSKYLPEQYKDYQIYFMVAGLFYTPDISKTDITEDLDWSKVRPLSFDNIPASNSSEPYAPDQVKNKAVAKQFNDNVNIGVYKNLLKNKLKINISLTDKTIIIYKWFLFDIDIKDQTLESYLKDTRSDLKNILSKAPPQPVIFMSDGYLYNALSTTIQKDVDGMGRFLVLDHDYNDIIHPENKSYQQNKLMKDITNAFVYFYQKSSPILPADFCKKTDGEKGDILDKLAYSYKNAPTGNWGEGEPFRNPILFLNIPWETRKCVFDYLLNKSLCTDSKGTLSGNACEDMLRDAIAAAKGQDQKNVLDYFNDLSNYKKLLDKVHDANGDDNYTEVTFALARFAALNGYRDTRQNKITDALFNFHNTERTIGSVNFAKTGFEVSFKESTGLHFDIVDHVHTYTDDNIGYADDPVVTDKFDCSPFTPVQFVYTDGLEFTVKKADGTMPHVGEIVTVPALYLQWLIKTDFKLNTVKEAGTMFLVVGMAAGITELATATTFCARLWAGADVFFTATAVVTSNRAFQSYVEKKWGKGGLEVLGVVNNIGMAFGGAYLGRGALTYLTAKLEQRAFRTLLSEMAADPDLLAQFKKEADAIRKAAAKAEKEMGGIAAGADDASGQWKFWSDYPKKVINGEEYAVIGNRYYSHEAIDAMAPVGYGAGKSGVVGQGVTTSVVEGIIQTEKGFADGLKTYFDNFDVVVVTEKNGSIVRGVYKITDQPGSKTLQVFERGASNPDLNLTNAVNASAIEMKAASARMAQLPPSKKNYSYLIGKVDDVDSDVKTLWVSSAVLEDEPQIFDKIMVAGREGDPFLRNVCSEYKSINWLTKQIKPNAKVGDVYAAVRGELKIISKFDYCKSCRTVLLKQFNEMFPNVKLVLIDGIK